MAKLPQITGDELVKALQKDDFEIVRRRGQSCAIAEVVDGEKVTFPVPVHRGQDLKPGTLRGFSDWPIYRSRGYKVLFRPDEMKAKRKEPTLVIDPAGFIGWEVAQLLLDDGQAVVGVDSLNDAYDPRLKR